MSDTETLDVSLNDVDFDVPDLETETSEPEAPESSATDPAPADPSDAAAETATPRDDKGRFAPKQPKDEGTPAPASAEAQTPTGEPIEAPAPTWQPWTIKADRETIALNETLGAQFFTENGHAMIAVPEANLPRLQQMIGRGIVAEKQRREFDAQRTAFEAERQKPRPPSDSEIEAREIMEYLKPVLPQILSDADLKWLEDKVALAKLRAQSESRTKEQEYHQQQQETAQLGEFQTGQLAAWVDELAGSAYAGKLSAAEIQEIKDDLQPYASSYLQQQKPTGPLHERYVFRDDLLHREFEKRVKRAEQVKQIATKSAEAAKFNAALQPKVATPAKPPARPLPTKAKPPAPVTGKKKFDQLFEEAWKPDNDE